MSEENLRPGWLFLPPAGWPIWGVGVWFDLALDSHAKNAAPVFLAVNQLALISACEGPLWHSFPGGQQTGGKDQVFHISAWLPFTTCRPLRPLPCPAGPLLAAPILELESGHLFSFRPAPPMSTSPGKGLGVLEEAGQWARAASPVSWVLPNLKDKEMC